jgi:hypothetical protein
MFPNAGSELVLFGVNTDEVAPLKREMVRHLVNLVSIGATCPRLAAKTGSPAA